MKRRFAKLCVLISISLLMGQAAVGAFEPVRLFVKEVPLRVLGKEVTVVAIEQADGTQGYSPEKAEGFHVEVVNQLKVPTSIHWHGLILPNLMDGVPFVTQDPILPGGSFRYDFPSQQSGTYWMHSHYGLQEQLFNSASLIIWTPEERAKADRQAVVMLSDFSFTPPKQILMELKRGMQMPAMGNKPAKTEMAESGKMQMDDPKKMDMDDPKKMSDDMPAPKLVEVVTQGWDDQKEMFVLTIAQAPDATSMSSTTDCCLLGDKFLCGYRLLGRRDPGGRWQGSATDQG
jgi:hypothetical protein